MLIQNGDWFWTQVPFAHTSASDSFGDIQLRQQLLVGPSDVRTADDTPLGLVTLWRFVPDDPLHTKQIFFLELTNINRKRHVSKAEQNDRPAPALAELADLPSYHCDDADYRSDWFSGHTRC